MRKTKKRKYTAGSPLIKRAVSVELAKESVEQFNSNLTSARIKALMADDGEDATELLAMLVVVIGTPCECGARMLGHGPEWVRQLHEALIEVRSMCLDEYKWDRSSAIAIDLALETAGKWHMNLDGQIFFDAWIEVNQIAAAIERHEFTAEKIADYPPPDNQG